MAKKKAKKRTAGRGTGAGRKKAATRRKAARASTRKRTARKGAAKKVSVRGARKRASGSRQKSAASRKAKGAPRKTAQPRRKQAGRPRVGGTGREKELAQTPSAGRSVKGPTNPWRTKRSTRTAAGAGSTRRSPNLERARRQLRELEENVPTPPSSLDLDRTASAARSGRHEMREDRLEHTEASPVITAGDVDADWQSAYHTGDEAPGGDNPTPDQDRVDDIGKALGVEYQDNEELKASDKIAERDRHRWELDPASSEDYRERD